MYKIAGADSQASMARVVRGNRPKGQDVGQWPGRLEHSGCRSFSGYGLREDLHSPHRPEENNCFEGLDERRKTGIITNGPRAPVGPRIAQGHHSRIAHSSSPRKRRREVRSYSGVLYEYRLERSRATRGTTPVWVVAPGARRRVFYFAAVLTSRDGWQEVPRGISEARRRATNTPSKIPETGAELEGWIAPGFRVCSSKPRPTKGRSIKSRQTSPETFRAFR